MTLAAAIVVPIVLAVLTGVGGYRYRRREHVRERRLDAYSDVLGAFQAPAVVGADTLSIHTQLGYPNDSGPFPTEEEEQYLLEKRRRTAAYRTAFTEASEMRRAFELSVAKAWFVAGTNVRTELRRLRSFLETSLWDGEPWVRGRYPSAARNPVDVVTDSSTLAEHVAIVAARELWRSDVPEPEPLPPPPPQRARSGLSLIDRSGRTGRRQRPCFIQRRCAPRRQPAGAAADVSTRARVASSTTPTR